MTKGGPNYKEFHMPAAQRGTLGSSRENPALAPLDPHKTTKLAQIVSECLKANGVHQEAKQIEPQQLLVAPSNRDGSPPNVPHIHYGILESFRSKGSIR